MPQAIARAGDSVTVLSPPGLTLTCIVTAVAAAGLASAAASAANAAATAAQACAAVAPAAVAPAAAAAAASSEASSAAGAAQSAAAAAPLSSPGAAANSTANAAAAAARAAAAATAAGSAATGAGFPAAGGAAATAAAAAIVAALAAAAAGVPQVGFLVVPFKIQGIVKDGSGKFSLNNRGAAHIGDQVLVGLPPVMSITGTIAGTLAFVPTLPMQGTIEQGSKLLIVDGRGVARIGDTAQVFFPQLIPFSGVIAGAPLAVPVAVLNPVRGFIQAGAVVRAG